MIYSDLALSQTLERTEARANADFVETRARLEPSIGAAWIEVAGTYAMFDGPESPCTQTFGLGMFEEANAEQLDELEKFFATRGAPVLHEVSPMADPSLMQLLSSRGYTPIELTSVMYREIESGVPPTESRLKAGLETAKLKTRIVDESEADLWARTSSAGWSTVMEGLGDFMLGFGQISARCNGAYPYLAELDGKAISTGMLFIYEDACILSGASTIPEARNQGAQNALLAARLKFAAERGCKLAIMGAAPGSQSQKNAQKNGFNIAYTRTKWHLSV
jgi:GNAT superfamily N-acetyltransferase